MDKKLQCKFPFLIYIFCLTGWFCRHQSHSFKYILSGFKDMTRHLMLAKDTLLLLPFLLLSVTAMLVRPESVEVHFEIHINKCVYMHCIFMFASVF